MKLRINNLCRVADADLDFDGITIIVGKNNTGKSTIGKALFSAFSAFHGIDERVGWHKAQKFSEIVHEFDKRFIGWHAFFDPKELIADLLSKKKTSQDAVQFLCTKANPYLEKPVPEDWIRQLDEVVGLTDDDIKRQIVFSVFGNVFHRQCASFIKLSTYPVIELIIKGKTIRAEMTKGLPICKSELALQHRAFYIDSPDALSTMADFSESVIAKRTEGRLGSVLVNEIYKKVSSHDQSDKSVVDDLLIAKRFAKIEEMMIALMDGEVRYIKGEGMRFVSRTFPEHPLRLDNLSQGLKSFALLYTAFKEGAISDYDVLILDEPEIHVHPEWQIRYAEFIVLLQKEFHLTVLLTSHSPDFVQAVRLFSQKHGLDGRLNGYAFSVGADGMTELQKVDSENWDSVFELFVPTFDALMALREEIEGNGNEPEPACRA